MARRDFLKHLGFVAPQPATKNKIEPVMTQEEQKVQELLKPRVIVENKWPGCDFEVGEILEEMPEADGYFNSGGHGLCKVDVIPYPYLMRPLHWWEERDASEMPEYVKYAEDGTVRKVRRFDLNTTSAWFMYLEGDNAPYCPGGSSLVNTHWLPATSADYQAYIEKQPTTLNQGV